MFPSGLLTQTLTPTLARSPSLLSPSQPTSAARIPHTVKSFLLNTKIIDRYSKIKIRLYLWCQPTGKVLLSISHLKYLAVVCKTDLIHDIPPVSSWSRLKSLAWTVLNIDFVLDIQPVSPWIVLDRLHTNLPGGFLNFFCLTDRRAITQNVHCMWWEEEGPVARAKLSCLRMVAVTDTWWRLLFVFSTK